MKKKVNGGSQFIEIGINNTRQPAMLAAFNANLVEPIVEKSIGYDLAVVRLKYPNNAIPLSERFLDTDYKISLSVDFSVGYSSHLLNSDIPNGSRFLWNYSEYITAFNAALLRCYTDLIFHYGGYTFNGAPYISLDDATHLMTLHNYVYKDNLLVNRMFHIFTNVNASYKFPFPDIHINPTDPLDIPFIPPALVGCTINDYLYSLEFDGTPNSKTTQDSASLALFSSLDTVVINCGFNITQELNLSNVNTVSNQNLKLSNTLTDLEITYSPSGRDLNGYDFYYSSGFVRRYGLNNDAPLTQVSVQLYWRSNTGNTYPLYLTLNTNVSMKLELREITNMTIVSTN
jgi:hypothetical protein